MRIKGGIVTLDELKFNFKTNDVVLNTHEYHLIICLLSENTKNVNQLQYNLLYQ